MKILLAADGSSYTKKALGFLVNNECVAAPDAELVVLHVEPPVPPRVKTMVGASTVAAYHHDESRKVLEPIERFLARHELKFRTMSLVGHPAKEILRVAAREKANLIVMGTHGHGIFARALMGSVAQNVVTEADVPVLLVK
jgi:nucleotide-binding universal stress UspA family protein